MKTRSRIIIASVMLCLLFLCGLSALALNINNGSNQDFVSPVVEKPLPGFHKIKILSGSILNSNLVNINQDGSGAIVHKSDLNGFVEFDKNLNIIDDFSEIQEYFLLLKSNKQENEGNKDEKFISGGRIVKDKIYFLSNYNTGRSTLYVFNKKTRTVNPFTINRNIDDVVLLHANEKYMIILDASNEQAYHLKFDGSTKSLDIPGAIVGISDTGRFIAYEPYDTNQNLSRGLIVFDISKNKSIEVFNKNEILSFNSHAFFSRDDTKVATVLFNSKTQMPDKILIFDLLDKKERYVDIYLGQDKFGNPLPVADGKDSLIFISKNKIELTYEGGGKSIITY